jgi:hypothetical protein
MMPGDAKEHASLIRALAAASEAERAVLREAISRLEKAALFCEVERVREMARRRFVS